jgi:anti-sigma-K factor RskA
MVESYVLGLASDEERREFEKLCLEYPELVQAREAFELMLEKQAMLTAIDPPARVKSLVLNQVKPAKTVRINVMRWAAAACIILLAGSIYWNIRLYNDNKKIKGDYNESLAQLNEMQQEINSLTMNPGIRMAHMKGMDISPQSSVTVYWDTTSHAVYLLVNNLPQPASDQQYQVWALLDGKPIDLGMIENEYFISQRRLLVKAKNVQAAQAFAITLEPKGGRSSPTMGKL